MPGKIFVNYRRDDARDMAARIRDRLAATFGDANVFMDVDNLRAGQRFDRALDDALNETDIFLAVIGPRWMELLAERQASGERDYVREEIAGALRRGIVVIPVLIERAPLPRASELPWDICDLVLHQKHDVAHERFGRDLTDLARAVASVRDVQPGHSYGRTNVRWQGVAKLASRLSGGVTWHRFFRTLVALAGATCAIYIAYSTVTPGQPVWRVLHDQSLRTFWGQTEFFRLVTVTRDGQLVTSAGSGGVKVWELATGRQLRSLSSEWFEATSVAVTPDSRLTVAATAYGVKVWDLATGREARYQLLGKGTAHFRRVAIAPDGLHLVSLDAANAVKVWELATGREVRTIVEARSLEWVSALAISPDGRHVISGSQGAIKVLELASGREIATLSSGSGAVSVAFTPDSKHVVLAGLGLNDGGNTVSIWNLESGRQLRSFGAHWRATRSEQHPAVSVAVTPDGKRVISGGHDGIIKVWDLETGVEIRTLIGHSGSVESVTVTPDGRYVISCSNDNTIKVWQLVWQPGG